MSNARRETEHPGRYVELVNQLDMLIVSWNGLRHQKGQIDRARPVISELADQARWAGSTGRSHSET